MLKLSNYSYKKFNIDKSILHEVNGALFPFDKNLKSIGVNLSGGADSALGTSILCSLIEKYKTNTKITVITNVRVWKDRPWQAPIAFDVYNKIKEMFPNVSFERVENYIAPELEDGTIGKIKQLNKSGDRVITSSFNDYILYTRKLEKVYAFITHNPTDQKFTCDYNDQPADRYWTEEKIKTADFCPQIDTNQNLIRPWMLLQKDFIMDTYIKYDWLDLLNITRSCEGNFENLNFKNYDHGITSLEVCGKCFWCAERQWAWEKANNEF